MSLLARIKYSILLSGILSMTILAGSLRAQSYDRSTLTHFDHYFTIGFERQVYSLYVPGNIQLSNKTKAAEDRCNRILFRMRLTNRFKLETGLSYRDINRILATSSRYNNQFNINKPCKLTVPLTIQYHLQSERSRLHPYFGAGIQYFHTDAANA